jgi:cytochrome o ubiquinol oxidase operon protein cyoD
MHIINESDDFGMGKKKLGIYVIGFILCALLTIIPFSIVIQNSLPKWGILTIIYISASIQLLVQVFCFLRLNTQTEQGKINALSLIFTSVILLVIVAGSIWIMWSLNNNNMIMS